MALLRKIQGYFSPKIEGLARQVQELERAIAETFVQTSRELDEVETTPGPEGPQGPAGPEGPQGPAGIFPGAVYCRGNLSASALSGKGYMTVDSILSQSGGFSIVGDSIVTTEEGVFEIVFNSLMTMSGTTSARVLPMIIHRSTDGTGTVRGRGFGVRESSDPLVRLPVRGSTFTGLAAGVGARFYVDTNDTVSTVGDANLSHYYLIKIGEI